MADIFDDPWARRRTMVTVGEAAPLLHLRPSTVQRYCRDGVLQSILLGRSRLIPLSAINDLLKSGTKKPRQVSSVERAFIRPNGQSDSTIRLFSASDLKWIRDYREQLRCDDMQVRRNAAWHLSMFFKTASARASAIPNSSIDPECLKTLESLRPVTPMPAPSPSRQEAPALAKATPPAVASTSGKSDLEVLEALIAASPPPVEPETFEQYQSRIYVEKVIDLLEV